MKRKITIIKILGVILISPFLLMAFIVTGMGYLICEGLEALGIEDND